MRGANYRLTGAIEVQVEDNPHPALTIFPVLGNMMNVDGWKVIHCMFSRLIRQYGPNGLPEYPEEWLPDPEFLPKNVVNAGTIYIFGPEMSWGLVHRGILLVGCSLWYQSNICN